MKSLYNNFTQGLLHPMFEIIFAQVIFNHNETMAPHNFKFNSANDKDEHNISETATDL